MLGFYSPLLLGGVCIIIWGYLLLGRGWFWRIKLRQEPVSRTGHIVAVVPARDEAESVGRCVASLLSQTGVDLRVVLVDDNSSDATADIARATALQLGAAERLTVVHGSAVPANWSGKLWAVQQGIDVASSFNPDYLLLTDADIEHRPENVASLLAIAANGNYDLASYMVKLHCSGFAERLLIPAFVYFFLQLYPPNWICNAHHKTAGAAGGCMLVRPSALDRAGAMRSIRGQIIDDCALAGAVKRSGGRVWLGLTETASSIRPYGSFPQIENMVARTAFNQLRHSVVLLVFAVLGLFLTYVAPVFLLFGRAAWLGAIALAMMIASYVPMVRFYRLSPLWALTLPFAALFYMAATIDSAIRYWTGRGGDWKGRAQDRAGVANAE
jgi:hopene-associated glycosyltransferase HpnB